MNMKIFDLHADIGMDVLSKKISGLNDILRTYHLDKLEQGQIQGLGMACFFEGHENWQTAQAMVSALRAELEMNRARLHFYRGGELDQDRLNAMITIEGMCFIEDEPETHLDWLYEQGARIGSLCWNDENALATGVKGNPLRGLTALGKRCRL
jgi:membrane dipeptidase